MHFETLLLEQSKYTNGSNLQKFTKGCQRLKNSFRFSTAGQIYFDKKTITVFAIEKKTSFELFTYSLNWRMFFDKVFCTRNDVVSNRAIALETEPTPIWFPAVWQMTGFFPQ